MAKKRDRIVNTQPFITDDASVASSRKRSKLLEAGISSKTMKVALAQQKEIADEENAESNPIAAVFSAASALMVTVIIVPAFRVLKASPILGFFFAGVVLNQFGFIRNLTDVKVLSEWGILFLLF